MPGVSVLKILVKGRNLNLLFERLRSNSISPLKIEYSEENEIILSVRARDSDKVFAILQNMWYNKVLEKVGFSGFVDKLIKNLVPLIMTVIFIATAYFADLFVFRIDINGVKADKKARILKLIGESGCTAISFANSGQCRYLSDLIVENIDGCELVTVKKYGNRLIIDVISDIKPPQKITKTEAVYAEKSGVIVKLMVLSGTPLKKVGDRVNIKEALADGYYTDGEGNRIYCGAYAKYVLLCSATVTMTEPKAKEESEVKAAAEFITGIDDADVVGFSVAKSVQGADCVIFTVTLDYLYSVG